jgi:aarF domain-containing kinase
VQLFEDNFIHADLHAGNLLVRPAPAASRTARSSYAHPQLVLLDAGLTIELKPFDRRNFISLFRAVIDNDGREVARLMMEYSPRSTSTSASGVGTTGDGSQLVPLSDVYATVIRPEEYMQEMGKLVSYVHAHGLSLNKISVSELLQNVLRLSYEHNVKLESRFVSVIVAIMLAEGMGRRLDPEVDIIARATPFIRAATINMLIK